MRIVCGFENIRHSTQCFKFHQLTTSENTNIIQQVFVDNFLPTVRYLTKKETAYSLKLLVVQLTKGIHLIRAGL